MGLLVDREIDHHDIVLEDVRRVPRRDLLVRDKPHEIATLAERDGECLAMETIRIDDKDTRTHFGHHGITGPARRR